MKINTLNTLTPRRELLQTSAAISKALERLSTGKRINGPRDGVADFASSVSLESQVRGLSQVQKNINSAFGIIQTADSAIATQLDIVQRMRELTVQAADGLLQSGARASINDEVQSLLEEFQRISRSTEFNDIHLLDGTFQTKSLQIGLHKNDSYDLNLESLLTDEAFQKTVGNGTFSAYTTRENSNSGGLAMADLNGDGVQDLINNGTGLSVFLGNADGTFASEKTYTLGASSTELAIGDFNGDNIIDIAGKGVTNSLEVLIGNGDGTFKAAITSNSFNGSFYATKDLDGDGNLDIVASGAGAMAVFMGNGDGTFGTATTYDGGAAPHALEIADINGDSILDLITNDPTSGIEIALGNGDGSFNATIAHAVDGNYDFEVADLNADGVLDLISVDEGNDKVEVRLGNGDGTFEDGLDSGMGTAPSELDLADFDGDGILDVVVGSSGASSVSVSLGNGDGTFGDELVLSTNNSVSELEVYDFDGDGAVDIVADGAHLSFLSGRTQDVTGVTDLNYTSAGEAQDALEILDNTIEKLMEERSDLNTIFIRLEQTQVAQATQQESFAQALSSIESTDFATETAELVKQQVMQQAQIAVQAQANMQLQVVLGLLAF